MGTNNPIPAAATAAYQRPDTPSQEGSYFEIDLREPEWTAEVPA